MAEPPSAYLEELVVRLRGIAGDRLVGVWLMGSAALGDFDPGRSDLDVQAVTSERLPLAEREAIVAALGHEALPVPASLAEALAFFAADDPGGAQLVLAACRAWAWAADGVWYSKSEAARWAQERLDDPTPVIEAPGGAR
jgi:hypothetical protein